MEHVYIRKCRKRNLKRMCLHQREGVVEGVVNVDDQQVVVRVMLINQKRMKIAARGLKETCSECMYVCVCVCVSPCHYSEGWIIVCSSSEEWEEAVEELNGSKRHETKQLYRYLNDVLLPDVLQVLQSKVLLL